MTQEDLYDGYYNELGVGATFASVFSNGFKPKTLYSLTMYEFFFDNKTLQIKDMDIILFNKGDIIPAGEYQIKYIAKDSRAKSWVHMSKGKQDFKEIVTKRNIATNIFPQTISENSMDIVKVNVTEDIRFEEQTTVAINLIYNINLKGNGSLLFYSGAIQPSDFPVPNQLNITTLDKVVQFYICSGNNCPFNAWFFNGSERCCFPESTPSENENGINRIIKEFKYLNINLSIPRARYFSLFASPC